MILKPIFAQLEITEECPLRCIHCYNYYSKNRSRKIVKSEIINALVENELFCITLTGGEPLLYRKILFETIKKFKEENMDVSLNSNLYLLKKEDVKIFRDLELNYVLSSILGPNENIHDLITQHKGTFKKLLRSLDYLSNKIDVSLNMVVSQKNLNQVYETGKFIFERFGIKKFSATPIVISTVMEDNKLMLSRKEYISVLDDLLNLEEDFGITPGSLHPAIPCMFENDKRAKYQRFFERRGCAAGKGAITFSPLGDARVCSHDRRIFGNILKISLEEILNNMDGWLKSIIPKGCESCSYIKKCNGGCRVSAEAFSGKINETDPYFIKPVNNKLPSSKPMEIEQVKVVKGNIRYREDTSDIITVYLNPQINARLNKLEFEVFKRFLANKNYEEISKEINDKNISEEVCRNLIIKGLLI